MTMKVKITHEGPDSYITNIQTFNKGDGSVQNTQQLKMSESADVYIHSGLYIQITEEDAPKAADSSQGGEQAAGENDDGADESKKVEDGESVGDEGAGGDAA